MQMNTDEEGTRGKGRGARKDTLALGPWPLAPFLVYSCSCVDPCLSVVLRHPRSIAATIRRGRGAHFFAEDRAESHLAGEPRLLGDTGHVQVAFTQQLG